MHSFFNSLLVAGLVALATGAYAQENDRAELVYTQRLSKQFPDSAFLLLKEMYEQSLNRKDRLGTGICLQQMGQICYYLGNYPKALDFHEQADKLFRAQEDRERVAANLDDMGLLYYYNRQFLLLPCLVVLNISYLPPHQTHKDCNEKQQALHIGKE